MTAQASALLQMPREAIREIAELQFLLSTQVERLLAETPQLMRHLATTSVVVEDRDPEKVAGYPRWGKTLAYRAATGLDHVVVTAPARRSYDTPENRMLKFMLDEISSIGRRMRWYRARKSGGQAAIVRTRADKAQRWASSRQLSKTSSGPPNDREVRRVASGRRARRYEAVIEAYQLHREWIRRQDAPAIREAVETTGLAVADDATAFEILATFRMIDALEADWTVEPLHVVHSGELRASATKDGRVLELIYQRVPPQLRVDSPYLDVLGAHEISRVTRRPDIVLRLSEGSKVRWCVVEMKAGKDPVDKLARKAAFDLHAYRQVFGPRLDGGGEDEIYGIGIVWGADLKAASSEQVSLCSFDQVASGLDRFLVG